MTDDPSDLFACGSCAAAFDRSRRTGQFEPCAVHPDVQWKAPPAAHAPAAPIAALTPADWARYGPPPAPVARPPWLEPPPPARGAAKDPATAAQSDLDWYASEGWYVRFAGRALGLNEVVQTSGPAARPQREDKHSRDWHRAAAIHRRMEALRQGVGRTHAAVLEWVYITRGPETRHAWNSLLHDLGWAFASGPQRASWFTKRKAVKEAAPREYGRRLHDAALAAFVALAAPADPPPRAREAR